MSVWDKGKASEEDTASPESDEPKLKTSSEKDRPVRRRVMHKTCDTITVLGMERATAFAKDEDFDTHLYCAHDQARFPVSEFRWIKE